MQSANQPTIKGAAVCHKNFGEPRSKYYNGQNGENSQYVFQPRFELKYFVTALTVLGSFDF